MNDSKPDKESVWRDGAPVGTTAHTHRKSGFRLFEGFCEHREDGGGIAHVTQRGERKYRHIAEQIRCHTKSYLRTHLERKKIE